MARAEAPAVAPARSGAAVAPGDTADRTAADGAADLEVEVIHCPGPGICERVVVHVPPGSTVGAALVASGLAAAQRPDPAGPARDDDAAATAVGVWGRRCSLDTPLRAGDRVEIYRPLVLDAKAARRLRQQRQQAPRRAPAPPPPPRQRTGQRSCEQPPQPHPGMQPPEAISPLEAAVAPLSGSRSRSRPARVDDRWRVTLRRSLRVRRAR